MKEYINSYIEWLRQRISLTKIDDWYEITTPFLDFNNDQIQIYAKTEDDNVLLSDGGNTIAELELVGVNLERSEKRKNELKIILNGFGVKFKENRLEVSANKNNFPEVKHRLIQAILSINDMFMLSEPKVENFFIEDIAAFFDVHDIRYIKQLSFTGKSGFSHQFDFSIPKSKNKPERMIRAVNTPKKDIVSSLLFSFEDTKSIRPDSQGIILLNDTTIRLSEEILTALKEYGLQSIPWSKRESYVDALRA